MFDKNEKGTCPFPTIRELVDELNELKLGCMVASLDSLYHSKSFDELDAVTLLEQVSGPEYQSKTSQRFQNRLKRAHISGGPQSLDKCKVLQKGAICLPISMLRCHRWILSVKVLTSVFPDLPTAGNRI